LSILLWCRVCIAVEGVYTTNLRTTAPELAMSKFQGLHLTKGESALIWEVAGKDRFAANFGGGSSALSVAGAMAGL